MNRPSNITNRIATLANENSNVPFDLYTINRHLDKLQNQIDVVVVNEQLAKNKIINIKHTLDELIKTQVALKETATLINKFLTDENKRILEQKKKYKDKKGGICKRAIADIKKVLEMNDRTLGLSQDLIQQINNI